MVFIVFIWTAKYSYWLYCLIKIARFLKSFILFLPNSKLLIFDDAFHLLDCAHVFVNCIWFNIVLYKIKFVNLIFVFLKSEDYRSNKNSSTWMFTVMIRDVWIFLCFNLLFSIFYFSYKQIHNFNCLLFYTCFNAISFCQIVECF